MAVEWLVDITCKVTGIKGPDDGFDFAVAAVMADSSVHNATNFWIMKDGKKSIVQGVRTNGNYRLLWDAGADLGMGGIHSNVVVRVAVVKGHARVQLWEGGDSAKMVLDLRTGERESGGDETLAYSSLWDGGEGATVTIAQDGAAIAEDLSGEGERAWSAPYDGRYVLTHTTYTNVKYLFFFPIKKSLSQNG